MASTSIQGRVDDAVWASIQREGETTTETLRRVTTFYQAAKADRLTELAHTPDAAIAILWHSHKMLNQFFSQISVTMPHSVAAPVAQATPAEDINPLTEADNW